jgi:hypothetical protein
VPVSGLASLGQMAYMVGAVAFALYFMVSERTTHTDTLLYSVVLATKCVLRLCVTHTNCFKRALTHSANV